MLVLTILTRALRQAISRRSRLIHLSNIDICVHVIQKPLPPIVPYVFVIARKNII